MARPSVPAVGDYNWGEVLRSAIFDVSDRTDTKADLQSGKVPIAQIPQLTSAQVTDFVEAAQDAVNALLQGASGVTLSYNDAANTLTITGGGATGTGTLDAEAVRDAIGVALIGASPISVLVNDTADTITVGLSSQFVASIAAKASIDDNAASTTTVYSSAKTTALVGRTNTVSLFTDGPRNYPGTTTAIPADWSVFWFTSSQPAAMNDSTDLWINGPGI